MSFEKTSGAPAFVFLFAFAVRLFYLLEFQDNPFFDYVPNAWDQTAYDKAAQDFAAGDYFLVHSPPTQFSFFYKFFLGIVYWLAGRNFFLIWTAQFLVGALSAVLVYCIALRLFDKKIAIVSSALFSLYGPEIFYEGVLYREFLVTFLALLSCYALIEYAERPGRKRLIVSGLSFALLVLCRPNMILIGPFIYWFLFSAERGSRPAGGFWKTALVFTAAVLAAVLPLALHTVYVQKRFVFLDDSGPRTLALGNLPEYPGKEWLPQYYQPYAERIGGDPRSYWDTSKYLLSRIGEDPAGFAQLYARKIFYFFNNYEVPSSMNYYLMKDFSLVLSSPFSNFAIYATLGLAGMVLALRRRPRPLVLYCFCAGILVSVGLFYIAARFRLPVVPFLAMFSSYAVFHLAERWRKISAGKILGIAACLGALFYASTFTKTLRSFPVRPIDYANMGSLYEKNQRFGDAGRARNLFMKAWDTSAALRYQENQAASYLAPFLLREGKKHYQRKEYSQAIQQLEWSVAVVYENSPAHRLLSLALRDGGRIDEAIFHAQESLLIDPGKPEAHLLLMQLYLMKGDTVKAGYHGRKALAAIDDGREKELIKNLLKPLEEWERSLDKKPPLEIDRVRDLIRGGELEAARKLLGAALPFDYNAPEIYVLLGEVLSRENDVAGALGACRHAALLGSERPELLVRMGDLARALGRYRAAAMYYRKALKYLPGDEEIKRILESLDGVHATTPFDDLIRAI